MNNMLNTLNNALYDATEETDFQNYSFALGKSSSQIRPSTVVEERAFAKGGCHATPSDCSL